MDGEEEESPEPDDLVGWRRVIADGGLTRCTPESVVAAIQTIGPLGDKRVMNALMKHISDVILRKLRRVIGRNHPNEGRDIIERAHGGLIEAVLQPETADGKALLVAFMARVHHRANDSIRAERLHGKRQPYGEDETAFLRSVDDSHEAMEAHVRREQLLRRIEDPRKRLAFRLHMEGLTKGSKKGLSIADVVGRSAKTVGEWIAEIEEQLKELVGDDQ
ncbi:MAG: hypothetical protein Q7U20_07780 [Caulobacter sp.]|nr:hypothetical protein [Caulobacter sp.]